MVGTRLWPVRKWQPAPFHACAKLSIRASYWILDGGMMTVAFDRELDARGLSCPLPVLKTKKALNDMASGQVLKITATDPGSVKDMAAFSRQTGHSLLSSAEESNTFVFLMKKK